MAASYPTPLPAAVGTIPRARAIETEESVPRFLRHSKRKSLEAGPSVSGSSNLQREPSLKPTARLSRAEIIDLDRKEEADPAATINAGRDAPITHALAARGPAARTSSRPSFRSERGRMTSSQDVRRNVVHLRGRKKSAGPAHCASLRNCLVNAETAKDLIAKRERER